MVYFRQTNFTNIAGGRVGFAIGSVYIDDLTIKSDADGDGEFTNDSTTEAVEDFTETSGDGSDKLVHDAAGNLTYDGKYEYAYDAWNRMVTVTRAYRTGGTLTSGSVVAAMAYDGTNRRVSKTIDNSGDWNHTYNFYHDGQSMIETRNGSGEVIKQHVWGRVRLVFQPHTEREKVAGGKWSKQPRTRPKPAITNDRIFSGGLLYTYYYPVDEIIQIGINGNPGDDDEGGQAGMQDNCDTFYWTAQDANYNVLGLFNSDGDLKERYEYTPYGQRTVFRSPGSNDVQAMAPTLESRRVEVGGVAQPYGLCDIGHQGLMFDKEFDLIYVRARYLQPILGRPISRDREGYIEGMNLYEYCRSEPVGRSDWMGLASKATEARRKRLAQKKAHRKAQEQAQLAARERALKDAATSQAASGPRVGMQRIKPNIELVTQTPTTTKLYQSKKVKRQCFTSQFFAKGRGLPKGGRKMRLEIAWQLFIRDINWEEGCFCCPNGKKPRVRMKQWFQQWQSGDTLDNMKSDMGTKKSDRLKTLNARDPEYRTREMDDYLHFADKRIRPGMHIFPDKYTGTVIWQPHQLYHAPPNRKKMGAEEAKSKGGHSWYDMPGFTFTMPSDELLNKKGMQGDIARQENAEWDGLEIQFYVEIWLDCSGSIAGKDTSFNRVIDTAQFSTRIVGRMERQKNWRRNQKWQLKAKAYMAEPIWTENPRSTRK